MEIVAQIFGIVGMLLNILIYQQKKQKGVLICQFFAMVAFTLNYLLLGAFVGGLLNLLGALRAMIFYFEKKTKANSIAWLIFFIVAFVSSYLLTFFVFKTPITPKNLIIEVLPVIAMTIATISLRMNSAKSVRAFGLFASPMWLVYNCFSGSIGAIASEVLNLISIVVGIIRIDRKKTEKSPET